MAQTNYGTSGVEVNTAVVRPVDRVRWGPILAGLFTTMAVLGVFGVAVGLSTVDAGNSGRGYAIGAGIWGAVSALLAFAIGGFTAARTAGGAGESNGVLNGAMVWVVTVSLMVWLLAGGVSALFRAAGGAASAGAQAVGSAVDDREVRQDIKATTQEARGDVQQAAREIQQAVTPQRVERAAEAAGAGAWWTLFGLLLGLGASALGGYLGSRGRGVVVAQV